MIREKIRRVVFSYIRPKAEKMIYRQVCGDDYDTPLVLICPMPRGITTAERSYIARRTLMAATPIYQAAIRDLEARKKAVKRDVERKLTAWRSDAKRKASEVEKITAWYFT